MTNKQTSKYQAYIMVSINGLSESVTSELAKEVSSQTPW